MRIVLSLRVCHLVSGHALACEVNASIAGVVVVFVVYLLTFPITTGKDLRHLYHAFLGELPQTFERSLQTVLKDGHDGDSSEFCSGERFQCLI